LKIKGNFRENNKIIIIIIKFPNVYSSGVQPVCRVIFQLFNLNLKENSPWTFNLTTPLVYHVYKYAKGGKMVGHHLSTVLKNHTDGNHRVMGQKWLEIKKNYLKLFNARFMNKNIFTTPYSSKILSTKLKWAL